MFVNVRRHPNLKPDGLEAQVEPPPSRKERDHCERAAATHIGWWEAHGARGDFEWALSLNQVDFRVIGPKLAR